MSKNALKIKRIIADKLGVDEKDLTLEARFTQDLGADANGLAEIIAHIEGELGIVIANDQADRIHTVGDAIGYIEAILGGAKRLRGRFKIGL